MTRVELWTIPLDAGDVARLWPELDAEEQARCARFHFERDRRRFTVAHAALNRLLARALGGPRGPLLIGAEGKPRLASGNLQFNLSHSGERALVALTRGPELGVDVEEMLPSRDLAALARRFFAPEEVRFLAPAFDLAAFYRVWSRKEAYLKARGDGLTHPLHAFDVSTGLVAADAARWALRDLQAPPGYAAALCVESAVDEIVYRDGAELIL